jgi:hypothetical protein
MEMFTEIDQQTLDIDWFFTSNEHIGFVASGGGLLPASVAKSKENNVILGSYFWDLPEMTDIIVNPSLSVIIGTRADERYLFDFVKMAKKGLFAFDKTKPGSLSDLHYHLVVKPAIPIKIDQIPFEISRILSETRCNCDIETAININLFG